MCVCICVFLCLKSYSAISGVSNAVLSLPDQLSERRWLRFLPFWLPPGPLFLVLLVPPKGPVLYPEGPEGSSAPPAPPPALDWLSLPGAHDRGGLQLPPCQQLCPLLPPHAALHQWTPTHMRVITSWFQKYFLIWMNVPYCCTPVDSCP